MLWFNFSIYGGVNKMCALKAVGLHSINYTCILVSYDWQIKKNNSAQKSRFYFSKI